MDVATRSIEDDCFYLNKLRVTKSRRMKGRGHVSYMEAWEVRTKFCRRTFKKVV